MSFLYHITMVTFRKRPGKKKAGLKSPAFEFALIAGALFGGVLVDFLAGLLIDDLHSQAHLAAIEDSYQRYPHLDDLIDHVGGLGDEALC
ncbi:MAG: hypothetical protein KDJ90_07640, partial [Nitratireductor sp.]|nr:hypothetical protein [Nitratireductor sp.]